MSNLAVSSSMNQIFPLPEVKFRVEEHNDIFHTQKNLAEQNLLKNKIARLAWNIFSIIFIPLGIARLCLFMIKPLLSSCILPAGVEFNLAKKENALKNAVNSNAARLEIQIESLKNLHKARESFLGDPENHARQVTIETADQVKLDTIVIEHSSQQSRAATEQKWIVIMPGNLMCYEQFLNLAKKFSDKIQVNVLFGNYRGVMRSEGAATSLHDLVLDGEAMIQYLLQQKVPQENILIHAVSLGGGVGAEVASYHQNEHDGMHLYSDRSFSTLASAIKSVVPLAITLMPQMNLVGRVSARLMSWIGPRLLGNMGAMAASLGGWKLDSLANFQKVKGKKFIIYSHGDGIIRYHASLYKALKEMQMTPLDRKLKAERIEAKAQGTTSPLKDYEQNYKPKSIRVEVSLTAEKLAARANITIEQAREQLGCHSHCLPILDMGSAGPQYIKNVKDALRII
ncbi:MAG: hypothetical protein P4L16_04400 [Chlamydiales bacterium]|nr:hypothetical protein [Chlamydiales bacterium]